MLDVIPCILQRPSGKTIPAKQIIIRPRSVLNIVGRIPQGSRRPTISTD